MKSRLLSFGLLGAVVLTFWGEAVAAPSYKIVHAFGSGEDGAGLWGSVILDSAGNVYGTTSGGGQYGYGTVFELVPQGKGQWGESILHSFNPDSQDGYTSDAGLTWDSSGNLFGTTCCGGTFDSGTVFELMRGSSGWTESVIYSLGTNPKDGGYPYAGVAVDAKGDLYGTTVHGGTVFEVSPDGGGWTETITHHFGNPDDGAGPYAGLILDAAGNLHGTTEGGGSYGHGTVYELHPTQDGVWQERLYSFCRAGPPCSDGERPGLGSLAGDGASTMYGTTAFGGPNTCGDYSCGTIFRITQMPNGRMKESVLYYFRNGATGFSPGAGVVRDQVGNLYGTTIAGGDENCGCGVVYKLSPRANGKWTYSVLHTFTGPDGAQPDANLTLDGKGKIYGTAAIGGPHGGGVVFEIAP